jgi:hypothetical protein
MWRLFIQDYNGVSFFRDANWTPAECLELYTDASGIGFGGWFKGQFFLGAWPPSHQLKGGNHHVGRGISIALCEIYPIIVACHVWADQLANKKVLFNCDNQSVVAILNKKSSKVEKIMALVRDLVLTTLQYNFMVRAVYIDTKSNVGADRLSRLDLQGFRQHFPDADPHPMTIPASLLLH